jgi:NIMA-interacting peptidyl-prolyl cis-trans isomerase 1
MTRPKRERSTAPMTRARGPAVLVAAIMTGALGAGCDKPKEETSPASAQPAASPPTPPASAPPAAPSSAPSSAMVIPPPATASAPLPGPNDAIIAQHVLVTYKGAKRSPKTVTRTKAQAKARALEALAKVRGGTAFEDVVDTYSDDAASVDRLGSVGKFHRGDMDPAFSAAAFALHTNEVSDVVETPFGFHIIKRTQ